jgi:ubiquinone/menaquinone biosynthesis C-methylase UbiE
MPTAEGVLPVNEWVRRDLVTLDRSYQGMYEQHRRCHEGLAREMGLLRAAELLSPDLLEIAGGTGWNIKNLLEAGFEYWGMDISETALAIAMMRYPQGKFINASINDAAIIATDAFDIVLSASMLEHLADYRPALRQMIRIARQHLFVVFFEGLAENGDDHIAQYPFENPDYLVFGKKFEALQQSYRRKYFWNRYARNSISEVVRQCGRACFEFLDSSNRSYLANETVLHVIKRHKSGVAPE